MIGVSEMTIVNWEKGRTKPTEKNIGRLRELLGNDLPSFVKWRYSIERKGKPSTKKNFER